MCSRSILVIIAIVGNKRRNERSLSSASAIKYSLLPNLAVVSVPTTFPPIIMVGCITAFSIIALINDVVVVLPWVPDTAIENFMRINSANISARGITGILF